MESLGEISPNPRSARRPHQPRGVMYMNQFRWFSMNLEKQPRGICCHPHRFSSLSSLCALCLPGPTEPSLTSPSPRPLAGPGPPGSARTAHFLPTDALHTSYSGPVSHPPLTPLEGSRTHGQSRVLVFPPCTDPSPVEVSAPLPAFSRG